MPATILGDRDELLADLGLLVAKSMVVTERREAGTRLRLLDTMRYFGAERLAERGRPAEIRTRHMEYYAALAVTRRRARAGPRELEGRTLFEDIWDNLRAAHSWAIVLGDVDSAELIVRSARLFGSLQMQAEIFDWMQRTIDLETPDRPIHPDVYGGAASGRRHFRDRQLLSVLVRRGIEGAERADHPFDGAVLDGDAEVGPPGPAGVCRARSVAQRVRLPTMLDEVVAQLDTDFDWWALVGALEAANMEERLWNRRLALLVETAARVRAPSLRAFACFVRGTRPHPSRAPRRRRHGCQVLRRTHDRSRCAQSVCRGRVPACLRVRNGVSRQTTTQPRCGSVARRSCDSAR